MADSCKQIEVVVERGSDWLLVPCAREYLPAQGSDPDRNQMLHACPATMMA